MRNVLFGDHDAAATALQPRAKVEEEDDSGICSTSGHWICSSSCRLDLFHSDLFKFIFHCNICRNICGRISLHQLSWGEDNGIMTGVIIV